MTVWSQAVAVSEGLVALIASFVDDQRERTLLAGVSRAWRRALRLAWPTCRLPAASSSWLTGPDAPVRLQTLELYGSTGDMRSCGPCLRPCS